MIEPIMIFGIGFLAAALCALLILPLVHNRAVRLTKKRLEAAAPLTMAEMQADKDQLRAEFAMATRRLELLIEHLKSENASQFAELGKKNDAINLFKIEVSDKASEIQGLKLNIVQLQEQVQATQGDLAAKAGTLNETERVLAEKQSQIGKILGDLNERDLAADSHRVEMIAVHAQVEALKGQINEMKVQINSAQMVEADLRARLAAAKQEADQSWAKEQAENADLRERISEIAADIARLTMSMEGPQSPIERMLAANPPPQPNAVNGGNGIGHNTGVAAATQTKATPNLADRIRAVQSRPSRMPTGT